MCALRLPCLLILALSLPSCVTGPSVAPRAVTVPKASDAASRRAEIHRQLAPLCPANMSPADLNAAADYLDAHKDAAALVGRLDRFDRETEVCRTGRTL